MAVRGVCVCVCVCVCVPVRAATALGLLPTPSASLVLDGGHLPSVLTVCCDSSAGTEVTCGSRLREDHRLLSARSVTSCQLGRVSCHCQPAGTSKGWPAGERALLLGTCPICIIKTENEVTLGGSPCPQTSCKQADAFKGMKAWGQIEFSFVVDSLPDFSAALNAEAFLY